MVRAGADIIDIGGESTRPGAQRISASEELRRVIPVARELVASSIPVCIDTMRAEVAIACRVVGRAGRQRRQRGPGGPGDGLRGRRAWRAICGDALARTQRGRCSSTPTTPETSLPRWATNWRAGSIHSSRPGCEFERIVVDPGIGFAKDAGHNWALLSRLPELSSSAAPTDTRRRITKTVPAQSHRRVGSGCRDRHPFPPWRPWQGRNVSASTMSRATWPRCGWPRTGALTQRERRFTLRVDRSRGEPFHRPEHLRRLRFGPAARRSSSARHRPVRE